MDDEPAGPHQGRAGHAATLVAIRRHADPAEFNGGMDAAAPTMRTIGLLGGMSWESSALYYGILNQAVRDRLGGYHSARVLMSRSTSPRSRPCRRRASGTPPAPARRRGRALEGAGAECVVLCTNTMHKVADAIEAAVGDAADPHRRRDRRGRRAAAGSRPGRAARHQVHDGAGLLRGTGSRAHGVEVLVPTSEDRELVHEVIYDELVPRRRARRVAGGVRRRGRRLVDRGAEGVVLGCTEIELLIGPDDVEVPVFATTRLHALAAVDFALG